MEKEDINPSSGYVWASEWSTDLIYTNCDEDGWSYALNYSLLSVHMRKKTSVAAPTSWSYVKRRKWVRVMRAVAVPDSRTPTPPQVNHYHYDHQ